MSDSALMGQRQWLPQFEGKTIRPASTTPVTKEMIAVEPPLDPALAIHKRFGQLIEQETACCRTGDRPREEVSNQGTERRSS